jgi:hypothetical protein
MLSAKIQRDKQIFLLVFSSTKMSQQTVLPWEIPKFLSQSFASSRFFGAVELVVFPLLPARVLV